MKKTILIFLFFFIVGCQNDSYITKETPTMTDLPQYSIEDVEKIARIEIPASASEILVYANTGWMDDAALIKFKLPLGELKPFLERYGFTDLKKGYWSIQDFSVPGDWWPNIGLGSKPPISVYMGGDLNFPGFSQSILIDMMNEDFYIIYLQCFET